MRLLSLGRGGDKRRRHEVHALEATIVARVVVEGLLGLRLAQRQTLRESRGKLAALSSLLGLLLYDQIMWRWWLHQEVGMLLGLGWSVKRRRVGCDAAWVGAEWCPSMLMLLKLHLLLLRRGLLLHNYLGHRRRCLLCGADFLLEQERIRSLLLDKRLL